MNDESESMRSLIVKGSTVLLAVLIITTTITGAQAAGSSPRSENEELLAIPPPQCDIRKGSYTGWRVCGLSQAAYTYTDGREEWFVIGMDLAVWHIWQRWEGDTRWSGWYSLGGRILWPGDYGVVRYFASGVNRPEIRVVGTDGRCWARRFRPEVPTWSDWFIIDSEPPCVF